MGITKKEKAGVVSAIVHFRHYILYQPNRVVTDHTALTYLKSIKNPTVIIARWNLIIDDFSAYLTIE